MMLIDVMSRGRAAMTALLFACGCNGATAPITPPCAVESSAQLSATDTAAAVQWNGLARDFVTRYRTDPSARPYALLSAAQLAATSTVRAVTTGPCPSTRAAVAGASSKLLTYLYPAESLVVRARLATQRASDASHGIASEALSSGDSLGRSAADATLRRANTDGVSTPWTGSILTGEGMWRSAGAPATPMLGRMTPWILSSNDQFRPAPPPAYASPAFVEALAEVRRFASNRTAEQTAVARQWAMSGGTSRLQGHWNLMASELLVRHRLSEHQAAHALALLNFAMNDASIACFDAKYVYWLIRPSQVDASITMPIPLSNHPSYPSSHSCTAGAGQESLAGLFPGDADRLRATADSIDISRLYGGVHYRFDMDTGRVMGQRIARLALARDRVEGGLAALVR